VLVVDPVASSRHTLWRLLTRCFGVIESSDAQSAREWLERRPDIDALVGQDELPDARGREWVKSLAEARLGAGSRAVVVTRPVDLRTVVKSMTGWLFSRDARRAEELMREARRLAS
jgi:DNA-binding NtrC family response regulator